MSIKRGDMPASPVVRKTEHKENRDIVFDATEGMTIREQFAMAAMQGYMTGQLSWSDSMQGGFAPLTSDECAKEAVYFADALLEELERKK